MTSHRCGDLLDDRTGPVGHDVTAEELTRRSILHELDEAARDIVDHRSLVGCELHDGGPYVPSILVRLVLRQPDARHLGIAERHARHDAVVAGPRPPEDVGRNELRLVGPDVGEHELIGHIAGGPDPVGGRAQAVAEDERAVVVEIDAGSVENSWSSSVAWRPVATSSSST